MKKQAMTLLLAAVLVLSGCGRQQLPEETPADMGLAAVAAIESHTPPALELTEAQTPPEVEGCARLLDHQCAKHAV